MRALRPLPAFVLALVLGGPPALAAADRAPHALAPIAVVLDRLAEPVGLAVDDDGALLVADRKAGVVLRLDTSGARRIVLDHLDRPAGLALDPDGALLVAEEGGGRLLRRTRDGVVTVLAERLKHPRAIAIGEDRAIYAAGGPPRPADGVRAESILRLAPGQPPTVWLDGFEDLGGLALDGTLVLVAASGWHPDRDARPAGAEGARSAVFGVQPGTDGSPGPVMLVVDGVEKPEAVVRDALGALYVSARAAGTPGAIGRVVAKHHRDGRLTVLAWGLDAPGGLALDAAGNLYVADAGEMHDGEVLVLRAPAAPRVHAPAYTSQPQLAVTGDADPGSLVTAHAEHDLASVLASAVADAAGRFTLSVPLAPNAENRLAIVATGAQGLGLSGAPATLSVVHDDVPPVVGITEPVAHAWARGELRVAASASDGGSGIASLVFAVDGRPAGTVANTDPSAAMLAGSVALDTLTLLDGVHGITVTAQDRAGNLGASAGSIVVDNTPPDTEIAQGPAGEVADQTVTFVVAGRDNLTAPEQLQFAWRLDGGPWSTFTGQTAITLADVTDGAHRLEVKTRDLAGNEDPTPADRAFSVSRLSVRITSPADGETVAAGLVVVRGTVRAGGVETGVTVNGLVAAVDSQAFTVLVPVTADAATLTAVATTARGRSVTHSVTPTVIATSTRPPALLATPVSGPAPLTVFFSILDDRDVTQVQIDAADGRPSVTLAALDDTPFTYPTPGVYVATVTATDSQGGRRSASAVVEVYDSPRLDARLRARWSGLKDALRQGDVSGALEAVALARRDGYRDMLAALGPQLAQVDAMLTDISLVAVQSGRAEYQMLRNEDGVWISYPVFFVGDADGVWRLSFF